MIFSESVLDLRIQNLRVVDLKVLKTLSSNHGSYIYMTSLAWAQCSQNSAAGNFAVLLHKNSVAAAALNNISITLILRGGAELPAAVSIGKACLYDWRHASYILMYVQPGSLCSTDIGEGGGKRRS